MRKPGRRIPTEALLEAAFIESRIPLRAFAVLTMEHGASALKFSELHYRWVRALQEHHRVTIGWARAFELRPARHLHTVLSAVQPLDCDYAKLLWKHVAGQRHPDAALVRPYKVRIDGLAYTIKSLCDANADIRYSKDFTGFDPNADRRFYGSMPGEARHIRRIAKQAKAAERP